MLEERKTQRMTKKRTHSYKNYLLISLVILSQLHVSFRGLNDRVDWFLFIDYTRRIDYAVMYLCQCITGIIFSYCLLYPKGISKDVRVLIFIITLMDLLHYFTFSLVGFGLEKLFLSGILFFMYKIWGR